VDLRELRRVGVDWIQLTQDGVQWRAAVNSIMSHGFHKRREISSLADCHLLNKDSAQWNW
jgi:hypothetical protein